MIKLIKVLLIPLGLCFLLLQAILYIYQSLDQPDVLRLKEASFVQSDAMYPPPFLLDKVEKRSLPDNWLKSMSGFGGSGWYQIHFPRQKQGGHVWGLFIPRANMNLAVFLNGHEVANSGHFSEPLSRNWARPLYYTIPAGLLSQHANTLHIHLKSYADEAGGLSQLLMGSQDTLLPLYQMRDFIQIDLAKVTFFLNIFAGCLALFLWNLMRSKSMYAWFAVICFSSCIFILNHFALELPISRNIWHYSVYVSIGWYACSLLMFTLHFLQRSHEMFERSLVIYMLISSVIILTLQNIFVALVWHIGSLAMASYACILLFRSWLHSNESAELVLFIGMLSTWILGFHDWYTRLTLQQFSSPVLMHLGPPMILVAISWILMVRFSQAMKKTEQFQAELIQRVEHVTLKLNKEHQRVQVLLQQEAKEGERSRIMKDLHDGLGSYLMSAHSIARMQKLDQGIQQALNDALFFLRTSIDALGSEDADLSSVLGTFRYRIEPQLKAYAIKLHWYMDDISEYYLSSEHKLHLIRIIQEAIANVIKHSGASELHISTKLMDDVISLSVKDNGCGISGDQSGHGLKNMRERIEMMGGSLTINALPSSGTHLLFML